MSTLTTVLVLYNKGIAEVYQQDVGLSLYFLSRQKRVPIT